MSSFAEAQEVTATLAMFRVLASDIEGWFSDSAAALWDSLLAWQSGNGITGNMLEIGVHHGKSAALMAMHARPGEMVLLADYYLQTARVQTALQAAKPASGVEFVAIRGDSRKLPNNPTVLATHRSHRWIHIDGEHTASAVTADLRVADTLLANEGVVVVDDFFSWMYPQITEAVFRYIRSRPDDLALFLCGFNKAYLARPLHVHRYLQYCAERLPTAMATRNIGATVAKTTMPTESVTFGIGPKQGESELRGPDWDPLTIRW